MKAMSEREIDQVLVERAQGGDKHAFDLLVSKYQRKLGLVSFAIRERLRMSLRKPSSKPIAPCLHSGAIVLFIHGYTELA